MTPSRITVDPLDRALSALDRMPTPDDGFTARVEARLDAEMAREAAQADRRLAAVRVSRRREARLQRWGRLGGMAGVALMVATAAGGLAQGLGAWTPMAVVALGLTTVLTAWLVAGRPG